MSRARYKMDMEALVRLWQPVLGLADWKIDVLWKRKLTHNRFAMIKPQQEYKVATLYLSESVNRKSPLLEMEDTIVHELAHCIQEPLMDNQRDETLERVTTDVARSLIRARDAGMAACVGED